MSYYVPGTEEKDLAKVIMSLQQAHSNTATNTTNIATNTASITAHEAAWTTYTPTISATGGTFTSASGAGAYLRIGKTVHLTVTITITTVGTATGQVFCTLPVATANRNIAFSVREITATGFGGVGHAAATDNKIAIVRYDNATFAASGNTIIVSGIYEAA